MLFQEGVRAYGTNNNAAVWIGSSMERLTRPLPVVVVVVVVEGRSTDDSIFFWQSIVPLDNGHFSGRQSVVVLPPWHDDYR